jgi:hypothetical protein
LFAAKEHRDRKAKGFINMDRSPDMGSGQVAFSLEKAVEPLKSAKGSKN